jgi:hypothetical protein
MKQKFLTMFIGVGSFTIIGFTNLFRQEQSGTERAQPQLRHFAEHL